MEDHEIKPVIEALMFVSGDPISIDRLHDVLTAVDKAKIMALLEELKFDYAQSNRGLQVVEVAGGYQITTRIEMAPWIKEMEKVKAAARLSKPGLETLAIIAYKQPVTRAEIEQIRGVDAAGVLKTLMERKLIKIVGRKEVAGRPMMYGTTREFLQYFGLADITGLPTLKEFSEVVDAEREGEVYSETSEAISDSTQEPSLEGASSEAPEIMAEAETPEPLEEETILSGSNPSQGSESA
ncbi:MAG: SMC-Scp complex subunit ScpB [Candidatus Manganitrophus sp. SA1]|nr:SMC-Scp complex subunit ScpB [Candidatus Manganitrophus morganii]